MKYLHIILPSKRMMETYVKLIREYYEEEKHTFYFLGKCPETEKALFDYKNVHSLNEGNSKFEKIRNFYNDLKKYDYIIWHGLVISTKFSCFLFFMKRFLKNSIWVIWGMDLYEWKRKPNSIKNMFINKVNEYIRKNMRGIIAIFPTDIDMYKKILKAKGTKIFYAPYPIRKSVFLSLENKNLNNERLNKEVWIQVGNNANSFNRHLEILETLKKYADENIRIFIPMSYGNDWYNKVDNYKEIVEEKAIEYFGKERVNILHNLMSIDEYSKYLEQIDVIIIATNRQGALGNILKGMYGGARIYLSEQNVLYKFFIENNVDVRRFESISNLTFENFIKKADNKSLKEFMIKNHYPLINIKYWNDIFYELEGVYTNKKKIENISVDYILKNLIKNADFREYANYMNLDKYTCKDKKLFRKIIKLNKLVFVGTDDSVIKILNYIFNVNKNNYKWNIIGIIDYKMKDLQNIAFGYNMIGTIKNYKSDENTKYIIACDEGKKREKYLLALKKEEKKIGSIQGENSYIGSNFKYEIGFFLGYNSVINFNCKAGKLIKIGNNCIIGSNCIFGDFVTIGDNCIIEDNTSISDYSNISSGEIVKNTKDKK